jgi:hypothetical protein
VLMSQAVGGMGEAVVHSAVPSPSPSTPETRLGLGRLAWKKVRPERHKV